MSDDQQNQGPGGPDAGGNRGPDHGSGPEGGGKKKRRRRRGRGGKRKRSGDVQSAANGQAPAGDATTTDSSAAGKSSSDQPDRPRRGPKPDRRDDRPRGKSSGDRPSGNRDAPGEGQGQNQGQGRGDNAKTRKKRKPRTKQCVNCFTPCSVVHKVRLDHRKQWVFICDICWPARCIDNPHYEYQATWNSGRINRPGDNDNQGSRPRKDRPSHGTPHANGHPESHGSQATDAAATDQPLTPSSDQNAPVEAGDTGPPSNG